MLIEWKRFITGNVEWANLHVSSEEDFEYVDLSFPKDMRPLICSIRGKRCRTKERLFQEFGAALQFPWYFGENWDAFDECICDLSWLTAAGYIIMVSNIDCVLPEQEKEFQIFIRLLNEASQEWSEKKILFRVIFHCEPAKEKETLSRLDACGLFQNSIR